MPNPGYGKLFQFEIPTADRTLCAANSDYVDLEDTVGAAFVVAVESNIRSPYNRGTVEGVTPANVIESVKFVGRNT